MEDLTKARQLPPEEIEAMRKRFKEAERQMDKIISDRKTEEKNKIRQKISNNDDQER